MKKLVITAFTTLAFANIASAQKPIEPKGDPKKDTTLLEELLKNEKLVKNYATHDYPSVKELEAKEECEKSTTLYEFSIPAYTQSVVGIPVTLAVGGEVKLLSDAYKIGAELNVGPQAELFGSSFRPIEVTFRAATYSNTTSSVAYLVHAMGYTLGGGTIASTIQPIAHSGYVGWSLPAQATQSISHTTICADVPVVGAALAYVCDTIEWEAHAGVRASIGAFLTFDASPAGVQARAIAASTAWAEVGGSAMPVKNGVELPQVGINSRLDVIRLMFGGRAVMMPQGGGSWIADIATSLTLQDVMGGSVDVTLFDYGVNLFELAAKSFEDEKQFTCKFASVLDPKRPPEGEWPGGGLDPTP